MNNLTPAPPLMERSNIILIGMPGAGKSTIGVLLAKRLGLDFLDTDLLIQSRDGRRLQEIIGTEGLPAFCLLEEMVLAGLDKVRHTVIATGGSAVYSERGMAVLSQHGRVVFLDVPCAELERRIGDMDQRGLVIDPGESFAALFAHRHPLYLLHADLTLKAEGRSIEQVAGQLAHRLGTP